MPSHFKHDPDPNGYSSCLCDACKFWVFHASVIFREGGQHSHTVCERCLEEFQEDEGERLESDTISSAMFEHLVNFKPGEFNTPDPVKPIYIIVEGGVIQNVLNLPPGITLQTIDYDTEGCDEERLVPSPTSGDPCVLNTYEGE